jgi:hypothetical protein
MAGSSLVNRCDGAAADLEAEMTDVLITTAPLIGWIGLIAAIGAAPRVRYRKVGGIRFLRIGRMQFTVCRAREG